MAAPPPPAQLYGDPSKVASEALDVLVAASPNLLRLDAGDETVKVVLDRASFEAAAKKNNSGENQKQKKQLVAVLAGGGSGHEPMAAGYVGPGCLSGAIAGDVFASPSTEAVKAALRAFAGGGSSPDAGVVLLVNNYTGDRLCFGAAAEAARARGQQVEVVFVSDDVALLRKEEGGDQKGTLDGDEAEEASFALSRRRARGLAGCILVFKIAGAAAAAGLPLPEVAAAARRAAAALSTMGLATSACALPGLPPPAGRCRPGAVELGMGLHGEAGAEVVEGPVPASELARRLWERIEPHAERRARKLLRSSSSNGTERPRAVLLVNSLGGCSALEASALAAATLPLARANFDVVRFLVGPFCTSLDMRGASVTLLPVDDELLGFIDAAVAVPAWPSSGAGVCCSSSGEKGGGGGEDERVVRLERAEATTTTATAAATPSSLSPSSSPSSSSSTPIPFDPSVVSKCLSAAAEAVIAARGQLDALDSSSGDGDCGATLAGAARDVAGAVAAGTLPPIALSGRGGGSLAATASAVGALVARAGGTSGGVYDIFFSAAAASLRATEEEEEEAKDLPSALARALSAAAAAVSLHGGAVEGDRTLLDALLPAARAAIGEAEAKREGGGETDGGRGLAVARAAAAAAEAGATATAALARAGAGRSAYVRAEALLGHADPGAVGAATWLRAVAGALE